MRQVESLAQDNAARIRSFRWVVLPLLLLLACVGYLPMTWQQQATFGALMVGAAFLVSRAHRGRIATLMLVMLSMGATARYAFWRVGSLERYFTSPWQVVDGWNAAFMVLLLAAELYSFLILYLGYMQTIAPLRRPPLPLPADIDRWPSVDVMIPTFNEPLEVVRYTVLAAKQLDWPADKLKILILDDGGRDEFRAFAEEVDVEYTARPEHPHAKAGNINYALERTTGELVAVFDCDHIPTRSFLQVTAGWFLRDANLAMLQTPHHFYSPDPFERNLSHFRSVPNEGELFYGVVQDTNDLWNAAFFCGSCAMLRRTALEATGGIAHESVTEDAHTSLRMQQLGWNTAYINLPQAAGLATETLAGHVKQRIRWARGMVQILRIDNPLFSRGLKFAQRLCYLNATLHFMYALPRLIFLTAPILYLVFGKLNIPGYWLTILVFAVPHLVLSMVTNSRIQGMKRYSFWNEIYETVLAPYILLPTLLALVSPRHGKFNVTAKGQNQQEDYFDSKLARPFLFLLAMNVLGLVMAVPRYLYWDQGHVGTIVMNVVWTLFNIVVLGVTLSICWESRQRRGAVRVSVKIPVTIESNGIVSTGLAEDLSVKGASVIVDGRWNPNDIVQVAFPSEVPDVIFSARIVGAGQQRVRFAFDIATLEAQEAITRVLYSRADRWLNWTDGRPRDHVLKSLFAVFAASARGFRQSLRLFKRRPETSRAGGPALAARGAATLLMIAALFLLLRSAHGAPSLHVKPMQEHAAEVNADVPLSTIGATNGILLDRYNRNQSLVIALPNDVLMNQGVFHLKYSLPESSDTTSTLEVLLNDVLLAAITPDPVALAARHGEATIPIPVELLVRQNRLTLRLADSNASSCTVAQTPTAPMQIDADSFFSLQEQRLVLASDLSLLPEPFVQRSAAQGSRLPVVFASQPSQRTLEAAGVLASWFGSETQTGQTNYLVALGTLPKGNAVVMLLDGESLPLLQMQAHDRARISMVANPQDPYGKLLVFSASSDDDLLALTQALALGQVQLSGGETTFGSLALPATRSPDDAPLWIHTRRVSLESLNGGNPVRTIDSNPWNMYLRLAPDYNFGPDRDIYLHLAYGNDAAELDKRSNLVVRLNGAPTASVPVRPGHGNNRSLETNLSLGSLPASIFGNTLQVQFYFVPPPGQECGSAHFTGTIGSGSYLDLGKPVHLAQLPNLHMFSAAGFPFTRMADLADTTVLLSDHASPDELALYLDLMGYFGQQTGYPTLRVKVASQADAARYGDKDLLMLGTYGDLAAVPSLARSLPFQLHADGWRLSARARVVETVKRWLNNARAFVQQQQIDAQDEAVPDGVLEQIQSPFSRTRTVVLLLGKDASSVQSMTAGLMTELPHDGIQGNVSVWQGGSFTSHAYSAPSYYLGDANLLTRFKLIVPEYPWALMIAVTTILVLLAIWLNACINTRIRRRLMGVEIDLDGNVPVH
jgi:cellulose synthase (UDP-forming)